MRQQGFAPTQNTGVILLPPAPTDFIAGVLGDIVYEERTQKDWSVYIPTEESQSMNLFDTMACVSFSALNSLEIQYKFLTGEEVNFSELFP